jgi:hypothetical protein
LGNRERLVLHFYLIFGLELYHFLFVLNFNYDRFLFFSSKHTIYAYVHVCAFNQPCFYIYNSTYSYIEVKMNTKMDHG